MRRVLVTDVRDRARLKRGGKRNRADLDRIAGPSAATDDDLLKLDDTQSGLAKGFPQASESVKMRASRE
jgi:hypothetical protein